VRKAALRAVEGGEGAKLRTEHLQQALDELTSGGRLAERLLGLRPEPAAGPEGRPGPPAGMPTGFPWTGAVIRRDEGNR
jgi:hypothetical protein